MDVIDKVRQTIEQNRLLSRGDTVTVAVSGGADSVALLHVLVTLRSAWNLTLVAAHLDHRLRPDSGDDARFVAQAAERLGVEVVIERADVRSLARRGKLSIEEAGREARYAFLAQLSRDRGARRIATGHSLDDHVETVLMRLLRGDPWDALAGIPIARPTGAAEVIRPLREVRREEIRAYLYARSIGWREDPSNRDLRFVRNWIRLTVLPALDQEIPRIRDRLIEMGEVVRAGDGLLTVVATRRATGIGETGPQAVRWPLAEFRRHPRDIQRRMLRWAVAHVAGTPDGLPVVLEKRGLQVASDGGVGDATDLGAAAVRINYGVLEIVPHRPPAQGGEYRLLVPGTVTAEAFGVTLVADIVDAPGMIRSRPAPEEAYLDAASVGSELRVRSWRPGDRMTPLGMRGKKKVQDVFVDDKIPRWERSRIPVVTDARGQILWIVGRRVADAAKITERTERVVRLRVVPGAGPDAPVRNTADSTVVSSA